LIHEQCGGGTASHNLLKNIKLNLTIKNYISNYNVLIDSNYTSIHIRNTDYKTDYINFIHNLKEKIRDQIILVCSDDENVKYYISECFKNSKVIYFENLLSSGSPLHESNNYENEKQRETATINSLRDLVLLSNAREFFFTNVTNGYPSGFSLLAKFLNSNKKILYNFSRI
jgi:hypothetical protein